MPTCFRNATGWYLGLSAYWFATSFKWFIILLAMLPAQVAAVVPGGEKNSWWGLVVFIGALEAMIGPAVAGYLSDRFRSRFGRRRPFIAIGAACTALALLFLGSAHSLWQLIVGYLFLQISDDIGTGPYSALIPDLVPEENRGRASGVMSLLQLLAQIAAAATGIALGNVALIYVSIAVVNIVCALIVLTVIKDCSVPATRDRAPGEQIKLSERIRRGFAAWAAPWENRDFRWVWITRFLNAFGFYLILLYLMNYLQDQVKVFSLFGVTLPGAKEANYVLALVISLVGALGALYAGKMADKVGRKKVIVIAGWVMFLTLVPFSLIPNYSFVVALAVVFGAGYGAYLSASWALAADVMPNPEETAKDMGIWQMSVATPQLLTGLAGLIVDLGNRLKMGYGYSLAFLIASFAFLFGCTLVNRVRGSR
jgi:MFS family permease